MHTIAALALVPAVFAVPWGPPGHPGPHFENKAAYFLDNNPAGSSVVSMHIGENGMLSDPIRTSTRGFGADGMNSTGFPNAADSLFSQDAVVVSGDMLFTINVGSNTIVMFRINPWDPYHPVMVGEPASTMGEFPMSVTYSDALKTACVMNGGAKAGGELLPCGPMARSDGQRTSSICRQSHRRNHSCDWTAGSASDILFTPDSSAVIVTIKGDAGAIPVKLGYFATFPVTKGTVSDQVILSQIAGIPMQFAATFLSNTHLLLTDPAYGVSILNIAADHAITELVHTVIPGQSAICWSSYDAALDTAYAIDAGLPALTKISPSSGAIEGQIMLQKAMKGVFDSKITSNKMYSLVGANGVAVIDLVKEEQSQFLDLTSFGNRAHYQGMAIWPAV